MNSDLSSSTSADDKEACLLYLSGDLSAAHLVAFEQRLEQSPQLADTLLAQSELLCQVALSPHALGQPTTSQHEPAKSPKRLLKSLLAIAACLAMLATLWVKRPAGEETEIAVATGTNQGVQQEDLLIAQAWAATDAKIRFFGDEVEIPNDFNSDALPKTLLDDSSLSWVSAAIESGASADG